MMPKALREEMEKRRRYSYGSVCDLLRFIRNVTRHLGSLPAPLRALLLEEVPPTGDKSGRAGPGVASLHAVDVLRYVMRIFPGLLTYCWEQHVGQEWGQASLHE